MVKTQQRPSGSNGEMLYVKEFRGVTISKTKVFETLNIFSLKPETETQEAV